jgi:hypothetical protein
MPRATSRWLLPVPARPTRQRFSRAVTHSSEDRSAKCGRWDRGDADVELLGCLGPRERGGLELQPPHPVGEVGGQIIAAAQQVVDEAVIRDRRAVLANLRSASPMSGVVRGADQPGKSLP